LVIEGIIVGENESIFVDNTGPLWIESEIRMIFRELGLKTLVQYI
jgi:hypothetical protein